MSGAGSFTADFIDPDEITWLDSAGADIELPDLPETEPTELPPEFFEEPPDLINCFRDFEDKMHCVFVPGVGDAPPAPGVQMLIAGNAGLMPQVSVIQEPAQLGDAVQGDRLEIACPAELVLTATFVRREEAPVATVKYRFRFAHGPVSTVFSRRLEEAGPKQVHHAVPFPLPKPGNPGSGGGVTPGSGNISVVVRPIEPIGSGGDPTGAIPGAFQVEALPDNEHKGSVRVEVVNAEEGVIASNWAPYHIVCLPESSRPRLTSGIQAAGVVSLQAALNRWLERQQRPLLTLTGRVDRETEVALRNFQEEHGLEPSVVADRRTWRHLLR